MTPEQKATELANDFIKRNPVLHLDDGGTGVKYQFIFEAGFKAGQQAAWEWIPLTPEAIPEPNVPLQLCCSLLHKPIYGLYDGEDFVSAVYGRLPKEHLTHFRYIPLDKPGEK